MTALVQPDAMLARAEAPDTSARGWLVMWRVELLKLTSQRKVRLACLACVVIPLAFTLMESTQSSVPGDTLFGRWVHESGFAVSLFLLAFCTQWGLPFLIAILSGDVCAEEDRLGTWPLLLTRSHSRGEVLAGKVLAAGSLTAAGTVLLGVSSTLSGLLVVGSQPLVGLSGSLLSPSTALGATVASWLSVLPPVLAITAVAVLGSVLSRNTWLAVVVPVLCVLVLGLVSQFSAIDPIRPFLPTTGFDAWHGLVRSGAYLDQIWTSLVVSASWIAACLALAVAVFTRRDVVA